MSLTASSHTPAHLKIPLTSLFTATSKTSQKSTTRPPLTPLFSIPPSSLLGVFCTPAKISSVCPESAEGPMIEDQLFLQSLDLPCKKRFPLTSFFSTDPSRSFALFVTLKEISPLFSTNSEKHRGWGYLRFSSRRSPSANSFRFHTYADAPSQAV